MPFKERCQQPPIPSYAPRRSYQRLCAIAMRLGQLHRMTKGRMASSKPPIAYAPAPTQVEQGGTPNPNQNLLLAYQQRDQD